MEREQIVDAVAEINKVLGLEPEIDTGLSTDELKAKLKEASELISEDDEFSEETKSVIDGVKQPVKAADKGNGADKPKRKGGAPTGRPVPKREGSLAEFVDNMLLAGTTWDELKEKVTAEAEKRGTTNFNSLGKIKAHVKFRGNSKKYSVTSDDTNVKMTQA